MTESFAAYNKHGSRSNKKLYPAHGNIANLVQDTLGGIHIPLNLLELAITKKKR